MGIDKRKSRRVPQRLSVRIVQGSVAGFTKDLSEGGMFIRTTRVLPVGTRLRLQVQLPSGWSEAEGEVRWLARDAGPAEAGMGIVFSWMSPKVKSYLSGLRIPSRSIFMATEHTEPDLG